ncbi:MAG: alpha/beta hydrolase [Gemmataceae bacterium]|nr:alpha/beta hydrolase [Gemmataceae bacterium]
MDTPPGPITLVLVHGFPLDKDMWRPQVAALSAAARVVAVDLPGFGGSEPAPFTVDSAADAVAARLDADGITDRVVVGGLSLGGYVAMAFARRHPDRLAALILADTRAEPDDEAGKKGRGEMIALAKDKGTAGVVEKMMPKLLGEATREGRPEVAEEVKRIAARQPTEAVVHALEALRDRPDAGPGLGNVAVPTLVLVGEHDTLTPLTMAEAIGARVYGSEVVTVPGAGHLSNLENPEAFNAAVLAFLAEVKPGNTPTQSV